METVYRIPIFDTFDLGILTFLRENITCPFLSGFFSLITHLGDAGLFWIALAVVLLIFKKTRKCGLMMGAALILGLIFCNITVKPLVKRIRPYDLMALKGTPIDLIISKPSDYSFPSGHTVASFEGATVIFLNNKKWGIAAIVLASLIAFSRLYLFVHYPTDILGGILMGTLFGILGYMVVNYFWNKFTKKNEI